MTYEQNYNKYFNIKYYDDHTLIEIKNIPNNNYLKGELYFQIIEIYKFTDNVIVKYDDKQFYKIFDWSNS